MQEAERKLISKANSMIKVCTKGMMSLYKIQWLAVRTRYNRKENKQVMQTPFEKKTVM